MTELTRRLPVELVASALSYLSESDLRHTAGVSRRWRAIALEHCDLCILFCLSHSSSYSGDFPELQAAVTYVCSNGLRFDLAVTCYNSLLATETASLARSLRQALGQLVKLSLRFFVCIPDHVYESLRHPARLLRQLHVAALNGFGFRSSPIIPEPLPIDLLGGVAPQLKSLQLKDIALPHRLAALANVPSATLQYFFTVPQIAMKEVLPSVRDLTIECRGEITEIALQSPTLDIRGLALTRLTVEIETNDVTINDALLSEIDTQLEAWSLAVPVVRRYCTSGINCDWTEAAVVTSVSRQYRMHWFHYNDETEFHMGRLLHELSFLADRLVYVRIKNHFLPGFLQFCCNMPVLRRLQLDLEGLRNMVWPPYHNDMCYAIDLNDVERLSTTFDEGAKGLHRLPCPALEELVISSQKRVWTVDSREAAHLGLALEQDVRPREERARLELRGVTWEGPVLDELLDLVFSTVVVGPFTEDDPDGRLWDPCFG